MWGEILTKEEVEYCEQLIRRLRRVDWTRPLVERIEKERKWKYETKPLLFELHFAAALHTAGLTASYEYAAGVADSTVDFRIEYEGVEWLIEVVSLLSSDAVREASWDNAVFFGAALSTNSEDPKQSLEGETLLAQQKIGEKVYGPGGPIKFPLPAAGRYHVVVADMRGFGITGGDRWDYRSIMYGSTGVSQDRPYLIKTWRSPEGTRRPILGIMDPNNRLQRAAATMQERLHFVGFCADEVYKDGSLQQHTLYFANPHLFETDAEVVEACSRYPLKAIA